jgi:hypothetical protein
MWYGLTMTPALFGPIRYQWDNGLKIASVQEVHVFHAEDMSYDKAWSTLPLRLSFYDYIGLNPTNSPMVNGDGVALSWFGPTNFRAADSTALYVRRTGQSAIDAPDLFGIHLALSGPIAWYIFSYPGIWVSDIHGITGRVLYIEPTGGFIIYNLSGITAHYIASSLVGLVIGISTCVFVLCLAYVHCRMQMI